MCSSETFSGPLSENNGRVLSIAVGTNRNKAKSPVKEIRLHQDTGIEGDCRSSCIRQISLLMFEMIRSFVKTHGLNPLPGDFSENIVTLGIDLRNLRITDRLIIASTHLEVTQIGETTNPLSYSYHGFRMLPTAGIFCRILKGGIIRLGDPIRTIK